MTTCTMTVDAGMLGEVDLTISYTARKGFRGSQFEMAEIASATIGWIKLGGEYGVEVFPSDDFITDEIIPHCVADWNADCEVAAEAKMDMMREERLAA